MRYLIICALALLLGYQVVNRVLVGPAQALLTLTAERIVNGVAAY